MFNIAWPIVSVLLLMLLTNVLKLDIVNMIWFIIITLYGALSLYGSVILWRYVGAINREDCECAKKI